MLLKIQMILLKLGNLNQNAKRYEARNIEREVRSSHMSEGEARDDFLFQSNTVSVTFNL